MILSLKSEKIKPCGLALHDGMLKITLTLPISTDAQGKRLVEKFILQHRFAEAHVISCEALSSELTKFVVHATTKETLKAHVKNATPVVNPGGNGKLLLHEVIEKARKDFANGELSESVTSGSIKSATTSSASPHKSRRRGRRGGRRYRNKQRVQK